MRGLAWLVLLGLGAIVIASCGGSTPKKTPTATPSPTPAPTTSAPKDETAFAQSMLLTLDDFPDDYDLSPIAAGDANPLDTICGTGREAGKTGKATAGDFVPAADGASYSENIVVFANSSAVSRAADTLPSYVDCGVKAINDGRLDRGNLRFGDAKLSSENFDVPGEKHFAYSITATGRQTGKQDAFQNLYFLIVYGTQGRVGYSISANGAGEPPDGEELSHVAHLAHERIRQQP